MTADENPAGPPTPEPSPRRRRPHCSGTHPRRFEERYKELRPDAYPGIHEHVRAQGRTPAGTHVPVLLEEALACLRPAPGDVVADGTVGYGGHALEFLRRIGPAGRLVGFDVDARELERTRRRLAETGLPFSLHRSNFAGLDRALDREALDGYDVIFVDLGVSSMQLDDGARGFSYRHDGPLDMRMDDRLVLTAADLVARMSEEGLSAALLELCDEPDHGAIARRLVHARRTRPLTRTADLVRLVLEAKGLSPRRWRQEAARDPDAPHPAALTFQALRILVNDELSALGHLLRVAPACLRPDGRIGIISFHSGEDRLVKHAFTEGRRLGLYADAGDDPLRPSHAQRRANPRCASARLRWARSPSEAGPD